MGAIVNLSLNLDNIDKSKVIKGKKGSYYNVTLSINDEESQFGDNVSAFDSQSKEERDAKSKRNYIGNGKVVWTDGTINAVTTNLQPQQEVQAETADLDLPF